MTNSLDIVNVDRSLADAIVIVDGACCTETWEEPTSQQGENPSNVQITCQEVVDALSTYLVKKGILREAPKVVLMSTHQADHSLVPSGPHAALVAQPLLVLTFCAYRYTEALDLLYRNAGMKNQMPPVAVVETIGDSRWPFHTIPQAMKNDTVQKFIAGALLSSAYDREEAIRRPKPCKELSQ